MLVNFSMRTECLHGLIYFKFTLLTEYYSFSVLQPGTPRSGQDEDQSQYPSLYVCHCPRPGQRLFIAKAHGRHMQGPNLLGPGLDESNDQYKSKVAITIKTCHFCCKKTQQRMSISKNQSYSHKFTFTSIPICANNLFNYYKMKKIVRSPIEMTKLTMDGSMLVLVCDVPSQFTDLG